MSTNEVKDVKPYARGHMFPGQSVLVDVCVDVVTGHTVIDMYPTHDAWASAYGDAVIYEHNDGLFITIRTGDGVLDVERHALVWDTVVGYLVDDNTGKHIAIATCIDGVVKGMTSVFYSRIEWDAAQRMATVMGVRYSKQLMPGHWCHDARRYIYDDTGAADYEAWGILRKFVFPNPCDVKRTDRKDEPDLDFSVLDDEEELVVLDPKSMPDRELDDQGAVERDMNKRADALGKGRSPSISSKRHPGKIDGDVK